MKLFLDDERKTPEGWSRAYTAEEAIKFLTENKGKVTAVSLDHDLGMNSDSGYAVICWLEDQILNQNYRPIPNMYCHSSNPSGFAKIISAIHNIHNKLANKLASSLIET